MFTKNNGRFLLLFSILVFLTTILLARDSGEAIDVDRRGRALGGHDVVSYFQLETDANATSGTKQHTLSWRGADWWFSSEENLEQFRTDPEKFAPKYGGYCSMAMAQDKVVDANPDAWEIREGKLYLFARKRGRTTWRDEPERYITLADDFWPDHQVRLTAK